VSTTDKVQGYAYWWIMEHFVLYGIQHSYFTYHGLETSHDGPGPTPFDRKKSVAATRLSQFKEALGEEVPDLERYFFGPLDDAEAAAAADAATLSADERAQGSDEDD
jgi:hypothetical protein